MASRVSRNGKIDRKIFRRTAAQTKEINIHPKSMRGGIRL